MTQREYEEHFGEIVAAEISGDGRLYPSLKLTNVNAHVKRAIQQGLRDFWGAHNWYFKYREKEIAVDGETVDMPDDFEGVITFRDATTTFGEKLQYLPPEEFDKYAPRPGVFQAADPSVFTLFYDGQKGLWVATFFRPPTSRNLTLKYTSTAQSISDVPERFQSGLESFIAKHIYPHGHPARGVAFAEAREELRRLQTMNHPQQYTMHYFSDISEDATS